MRNNKGITIAALIIAIIGLSVGFAAFSNTLTIRSTATVTPSSSNMRVVFSTSTSGAVAGNISPNNSTYGGTANINSSDLSILENLNATFTAPNQSVTYSTNLYVYNDGAYTAYLTDLTMGSITCAATTENVAQANRATASLVEDACEDISVSVTIDNVTKTSSGSLGNITIAPGGYKTASVTISYANNNHYVDGPMTVTIGDITFTASTVQATVNYPVAGTYNRYMASSQNPTTSFTLASNGTGTVNMGSSLDLTYEYSNNDSTVTFNVMGTSQQWNYASISGNQIIYTTSGGNMIFATNGGTGITPLEGFTYTLSRNPEQTSGPTSYTFGSNGTVTDSDSNTGTYAVIDGILYFLIDGSTGLTNYNIAQDYSQFGESLRLFIKQSE